MRWLLRLIAAVVRFGQNNIVLYKRFRVDLALNLFFCATLYIGVCIALFYILLGAI